jgi:hypothetical protein
LIGKGNDHLALAVHRRLHLDRVLGVRSQSQGMLRKGRQDSFRRQYGLVRSNAWFQPRYLGLPDVSHPDVLRRRVGHSLVFLAGPPERS